jgi:hypothetical protein
MSLMAQELAVFDAPQCRDEFSIATFRKAAEWPGVKGRRRGAEPGLMPVMKNGPKRGMKPTICFRISQRLGPTQWLQLTTRGGLQTGIAEG